VLTASRNIAVVIGTDVFVVAIYRRPGQAGSLVADVRIGAKVSIIAWNGVGGMETANSRVTGIVGAEIPVIAIDRYTTSASPIKALGVNFACITFIAQKSSVVWGKSAFTRPWITDRLLAIGGKAFCFRTRHDRFLVHNALVGQRR